MKKITENKIKKLEENGLQLSYDKDDDTAYLGKKKLNKSNLRAAVKYDEIKKAMKDMTDEEVVRALTEYSMRNEYYDESKEAKKAKAKEKADKKAAKEAKKAKEKADIEARLDKSKMEDWEKMMIYDEKGFIDRFQKRNIYAFFKYKDEYKNKFKYNTFSGIETFNSKLMEDHIVTALSLVTEEYIQNNNESWVKSVTNMLCHENEFHPIVNALDMLPKWDGKQRLETFFIDYIGGEDTKLTRNITKKFFYAMFERLFRPGCRFDHMLITYDETHGTGKSTIVITLLEALQELAGNDVEDSGIIALNELGFDKDTVQCLNKAWIAYVDELAKFLKEEPEEVKKFITLTVDNARLSYARLNKNFPRHCVFYGSTNTKTFIKDTTDEYERRWWIINCNGKRHESKKWWDENLPSETKLQILAEAYEFWKNEPNYEYNELDEDDIETLKMVQKDHTTFSNDDILSYKLLTILDFDYSKDTFDTYYEWANEAKMLWEDFKQGKSDTMNYVENTFFDQKNSQNLSLFYTETNKKDTKKLRKIPIIWLKQFIQEELGRGIQDNNYIRKLIGIYWNASWNAYYEMPNDNKIKGIYKRLSYDEAATA